VTGLQDRTGASSFGISDLEALAEKDDPLTMRGVEYNRHDNLTLLAGVASARRLPADVWSRSRQPVPCKGFSASAPGWSWRNTGINIVDTYARIAIIVDTVLIHGRSAMKVLVKKWGNSAAVRIPAAVMQAMELSLDEEVDVREESGRIVIEPLQRKVYDLRTLLKSITAKNLDDPIDFGGPMGKEVW